MTKLNDIAKTNAVYFQQCAAVYAKQARLERRTLVRNGGVDGLSRTRAIIAQHRAEWAAARSREILFSGNAPA
jgi:hypothetical protein